MSSLLRNTLWRMRARKKQWKWSEILKKWKNKRNKERKKERKKEETNKQINKQTKKEKETNKETKKQKKTQTKKQSIVRSQETSILKEGNVIP